jgi:GH35 family endo-1,4-beta-xylanase
VYISECDLDLASDSEQEAVLSEQFPVFYEHPAVVGVTLWGYIHGTTWVPDSGLVRNGQPRPAMTWLLDYLGR